MKIANLSQLKKALAAGHNFEIVEHFVRPEQSGQIRSVNILQTNGMYTYLENGDEFDTRAFRCYNMGKGSWCEFGKASDWDFRGDLCTFSIRGHKVWTIRVLDNAA